MTNCNTAGTLGAKVRVDWSVAAVLPSKDGSTKQAGLAGPVAGLIKDRLFISGGANFEEGMPWRGAKKIYHDEIYLAKKDRDGAVVAVLHEQHLPQPVAYCASVSTPEGLVYIGGENADGISAKTMLVKYLPETDSLQFTELPLLPVALTNLAAACVDNVLYVAGGNSQEGTTAYFFSLDLSVAKPGWKPLPGLPVPTAYAVMIAQSNGEHPALYLLGGRRKNSNGLSDILQAVYQYDISNNHWIEKQPMPYAVSAGTGVAVGENHIMMIGGDRGEIFSKEEKLNVKIRAAADPQRQLLTDQKIALLESHPGFGKEVLVYNTITGKWMNTDELTVTSPVTTTAINWDGDIFIPSGEIKAGVRTPEILEGKIR